MEYKEFMQYIKELQNYYNQELTENEVDIWYENLKFMTIQRFNYIISEIYKINKFMPKLSEVLAVHKQIPYEVGKTKKEIKGHCNKCNDTGYVFYKKILDGNTYTYTAVCDCGRQQRYDGRQCQDKRNTSEYYVPTTKEMDLKIESHMPRPEEVVKSMKKLQDSSIISEDIKNLIREEFRKRVLKK